MSQKQQVHKRIVLLFMKEVFEAYTNKRIDLAEARTTLSLSRSSFFRYLKMYRSNPSGFGISYIRTSVNRKLSVVADEKIAEILRDEKELIRDPNVRVGKYNFSALSEELKRENGISASSETIRKKAIAWKMHHPKTRFAKIYREVETTKIGRLFQHDTCIHQWSPFCKAFYLILTVDDHSRKIVYAKFFAQETSMNHILAVRDTVQKYGLPLAYYTDRHSIFTFNFNNGPRNQTYQTRVEDADVQWKCVLSKLQIQGICANSPQAKGKVESKFKYLQGRVVRRCAKEEVTTFEHAQRILDEEVRYYNEFKIHAVTEQTPQQRFELAEKEGRSVLRPFKPEGGQSWKDIFCLEYEKKLDRYGRTKVKGIEIQVKSSPSQNVTIRYIEENGEKEIIVLAKNTVLKSFRI